MVWSSGHGPWKLRYTTKLLYHAPSKQTTLVLHHAAATRDGHDHAPATWRKATRGLVHLALTHSFFLQSALFK
jgi:hypothetical protein